jgi:hypothetical protein
VRIAADYHIRQMHDGGIGYFQCLPNIDVTHRSHYQGIIQIHVLFDAQRLWTAAHLCRFGLTHWCLNVKAVQGHRSPRMLRIRILKFIYFKIEEKFHKDKTMRNKFEVIK